MGINSPLQLHLLYVEFNQYDSTNNLDLSTTIQIYT